MVEWQTNKPTKETKRKRAQKTIANTEDKQGLQRFHYT